MPYKILFARNSGKTFQVDFIPSYDQKGILERTEPVPFRLTRNLHTFFTPFGVEGVFVSAMAAAAQVRLQPTFCKPPLLLSWRGSAGLWVNAGWCYAPSAQHDATVHGAVSHLLPSQGPV